MASELPPPAAPASSWRVKPHYLLLGLILIAGAVAIPFSHHFSFMYVHTQGTVTKVTNTRYEMVEIDEALPRDKEEVEDGVKIITRYTRADEPPPPNEADIAYEFKDTEGKTQKGSAKTSEPQFQKVTIGDIVRIQYLPQAPNANKLDTHIQTWEEILAAAALGLLGLIVLLWGTGLFGSRPAPQPIPEEEEAASSLEPAAVAPSSSVIPEEPGTAAPGPTNETGHGITPP